jgi:transcriptional regulator GlxA family with amidase domain
MNTPVVTKPLFVICIPIYNGVDLMDVAAPTEVFTCLNESWREKQVVIYHVAEVDAKVITRDGTIIYPHKTFAELTHADLLWTPGGDPEVLYCLMYSEFGTAYLNYLKQISATATWTTSVCEGALLLAQAGLLNGYSATTHWAFMNCLKAFTEINVIDDGHPRYAIDRDRVTGAGISSGLDESLAIVELIAGTANAIAVQQFIQYFPKPPVSGSIPRAGKCPVTAPRTPCGS